MANAQYMASIGIGEMMQFGDVTADKLQAAIQAVASEPRYTKTAREIGGLLKDQIDRPLDRAVWWIEHLIRNPNYGAHMRSPVHDLAWYQYFLLDVIAGYIVIAVVVLGIVYKLFSCLLGVCCSKKSDAGKRKKKRE